MRKSETVTITAEGRDKGKRFLITEMSAMRAEDWALRALLALTHAGAELPEDVAEAGMAGLAVTGLQALQRLQYEDVKPLFDEMLECVQLQPDARHPEVVRPVNWEIDVDEPATLFTLRRRIFDMHTSFFTNGARSASDSTSSPTSQG